MEDEALRDPLVQAVMEALLAALQGQHESCNYPYIGGVPEGWCDDLLIDGTIELEPLARAAIAVVTDHRLGMGSFTGHVDISTFEEGAPRWIPVSDVGTPIQPGEMILVELPGEQPKSYRVMGRIEPGPLANRNPGLANASGQATEKE